MPYPDLKQQVFITAYRFTHDSPALVREGSSYQDRFLVASLYVYLLTHWQPLYDLNTHFLYEREAFFQLN